jgi:hypothetical protein
VDELGIVELRRTNYKNVILGESVKSNLTYIAMLKIPCNEALSITLEV